MVGRHTNARTAVLADAMRQRVDEASGPVAEWEEVDGGGRYTSRADYLPALPVRVDDARLCDVGTVGTCDGFCSLVRGVGGKAGEELSGEIDAGARTRGLNARSIRSAV